MDQNLEGGVEDVVEVEEEIVEEEEITILLKELKKFKKKVFLLYQLKEVKEFKNNIKKK